MRPRSGRGAGDFDQGRPEDECLMDMNKTAATKSRITPDLMPRERLARWRRRVPRKPEKLMIK